MLYLFLTATFPLSILVSSLMEGENVIDVILVGSEGSTATARFNVRLGTLTFTIGVCVSQDFAPTLQAQCPLQWSHLTLTALE